MDMEPGFAFRHELRVRFTETDAQQIVYHANYLVYCDVARVEYFRALAGGGHPFADVRDWDVVIAHAACDFRASARFDDLLTVWMRLGKLGRTSFGFDYRIERAGELVCEARTVHVAIDRQARAPRPIPSALADGLRAFEASLRPLRA